MYLDGMATPKNRWLVSISLNLLTRNIVAFAKIINAKCPGGERYKIITIDFEDTIWKILHRERIYCAVNKSIT